MANLDLRSLPKVRDSWSYLYADRCRIEVEDKSIAILDEHGKTPVPCSSLSLLLLGPGSTVTHAAIRALADNGCMVAWTGEEGVRMYAFGTGETRSARNLYRQIHRWADKEQRIQVVRALYALRFPKDAITPHTTLKQLRGMEGARMRHTYAEMSKNTGIPWQGRMVGKGKWEQADPVNRALSSANAALYGICHAAIVALGYSPAVGFIHTGKQLSFVYDIADLYKTIVSIPAAFATAAVNPDNVESYSRQLCRDAFREQKILEHIVADIETVLKSPEVLDPYAEDATLPGGLWDPETGIVAGGVNYGANIDLPVPTNTESWVKVPDAVPVEDDGDFDANEVEW